MSKVKELNFDTKAKQFEFDVKQIDTKGNRRFIRNQVIELAKSENKGDIKTYWNYFRKNTNK